MKPSVTTSAIILNRVDYGEADRILTLLTPDHGKLSLMAKGVRKIKSKLAGGIELFCISTVTFVEGRGSVGTLVSTRLSHHFPRIVQDLDRTTLGYDLLKQIHKITEDHPGPEYFKLLSDALEALDDPKISLDLIRLWFSAQLLLLGGHSPNLKTDASGQALDPSVEYEFDLDKMCLTSKPGGRLGARHIKFLRLVFDTHSPKVLAQVEGGELMVGNLAPLVATMLQIHLRV